MKWYDGLTIAKDPNSVLNYAWDFTDWLITGDSLSDHSVIADAGITVDSSAINGAYVDVVLSGGTVGTSYDVTVRVTTSNGYVVDRTVIFSIGER